jgi:hypothetical protein
MRSRRRSAPPPRKTQTVFDPTTVAEIAAGYFWDPASASGLGGAGFKIPEGNGHTSFDLVQATVAKQPTALTENGAAQFRVPNTAGQFVSTAGAVQAGWTGSTYMAAWLRLPNANGDITGADTFFGHNPLSTGQRRLIITGTNATPDLFSATASTAGTATASNSWGNPLVGSNWVFVETLFDTSLASPASLALYADFALLVPSATAAIPSTLFDGLAPIGIACRFAVSNNNIDTTDFGPFYYGNGIPSLANRKRLRNRHRPVAVAV